MMIPQSFIPPDPTKIGEYIAAGFKLGTDFAVALTDVIVKFIQGIGTFLA
jgi:hypothetical protein